MTRIEQIAKEIADTLYPVISHWDGSETQSEVEHAVIKGLIMELALEIKRAAIEGEW